MKTHAVIWAIHTICAMCGIAGASWPAASAAGEADTTARVIAGFPASLDRFGRAGSDPWRAYAREISSHWAEYDRRIARPMRRWACQELEPLEGGTVFYPFSGPDLPSVVQLFPGADRYVLVSLQRAGAPPRLESFSGDELENYRAAVRKAWKFFGILGFFRTDDLEAVENAGRVRVGITGPLMAFAVRLGYDIESVEPIRLDPGGDYVAGVVARDAPGAQADTWNSVRIRMWKDKREVLVDYVQMDLSDAWLAQYAPARDWLERMALNPTLLKAASHHPQGPDFSIVRESILRNAPTIVQDETGIDFADLAETFRVRLYGRFTAPNRSFSSDLQRSLGAAYRSGAPVKALPFRLGYEKNAGSAMQVAVREPNAVPDAMRLPRECARTSTASGPK
jgi:hypothetical protein